MDGQKLTIKGLAQRHIVLFVIVMLVCVLLNNIVTSFAMAPFEDNVTAAYLWMALCKYATALIPLFLMIRWRLVQKSGARNVLAGILLGLPTVLLIAENLLPFALIKPASYRVQWLPVAAIAVAFLGVGLMEETACRGVLLPLLCEKWSDRKNGCMKAALFSSALFGCAHLVWIANALIFDGAVSMAECLGRLYQVYYSFCFGMLCAGVALYSKSVIPMVIWHSLVDIAAFIGKGILFPTTYQYYFENNAIGFGAVLVQKGIVQDAGCLSWALPVGMDAVLLAAGAVMVKKADAKRMI